jgi:hypothetical protein
MQNSPFKAPVIQQPALNSPFKTPAAHQPAMHSPFKNQSATNSMQSSPFKPASNQQPPAPVNSQPSFNNTLSMNQHNSTTNQPPSSFGNTQNRPMNSQPSSFGSNQIRPMATNQPSSLYNQQSSFGNNPQPSMSNQQSSFGNSPRPAISNQQSSYMNTPPPMSQQSSFGNQPNNYTQSGAPAPNQSSYGGVNQTMPSIPQQNYPPSAMSSASVPYGQRPSMQPQSFNNSSSTNGMGGNAQSFQSHPGGSGGGYPAPASTGMSSMGTGGFSGGGMTSTNSFNQQNTLPSSNFGGMNSYPTGQMGGMSSQPGSFSGGMPPLNNTQSLSCILTLDSSMMSNTNALYSSGSSSGYPSQPPQQAMNQGYGNMQQQPSNPGLPLCYLY